MSNLDGIHHQSSAMWVSVLRAGVGVGVAGGESRNNGRKVEGLHEGRRVRVRQMEMQSELG